MFCHLILGFLRDGRPRHGYELLTEHHSLLGERINPGSLYRELGRLSAQGLVQAGANPPEADPRRIPYQITEHGKETFDHWLFSPSSDDGDFPAWLVFIDRVPADVRTRILERRQEDLWVRGKVLARNREDALARSARTLDRYDPLPALLSRRLKLNAAEVDSLTEFTRWLEGWQQAQQQRMAAPAAARSASRRRKRIAGK